MFYLYYASHVSNSIEAMAFKLSTMVNDCKTYAHVIVDYLDRDARSQWVGKGIKSALNISTFKQATSIKLATMVGHF